MVDNFKTKTFLIVDDFSDMRSLLRGLLRTLDVNRIDLAAHGNEAISCLEKNRYDVILCDYNLGDGKDGQQVLEEARHRQLIGVDAIFIMITAENTREMVMAAAEYTPDGYLTKPFTRELLHTRLTRLFELKSNLSGVNRSLMKGKYDAAIGEIDRLLKQSPPSPSELLKLKAEICTMAKRFDEAMEIYQNALAHRDQRWARMGVGKLQLLKKQYPQAEETFANLIAADGGLIAAYDYLAQAQIAQGRFPEAERILETAVKLSPRALKRQRMLGDVALGNGNTAAAETAFNRAATLARHSIHGHPAIFAGLAKSLTANGKHDQALKAVEQIGKTFSGHDEATFYAASAKAIVKANQGDTEGAEEALRAAEQAMSNASGAAATTLGLEMVKTYSRLGERGKAAALLQTAIANNHDDDAFLAEVKQVYQMVGIDEQGDAAIHEIRQEIVRTNNAGVSLIKQGEFDAAIKLLRKAADEMPRNKTVNLNAAKALIMKMDRQGATGDEIQQVRVFIDRVQRAAPDDWRLAEVTAHLNQLAAKF